MEMPDRFEKTKLQRMQRTSYSHLKAWAEDFKKKKLFEGTEDLFAFEDLCSIAMLADEHRKQVTDLSQHVRLLSSERTRSDDEVAFFRSIIRELVRKMDPYD